MSTDHDAGSHEHGHPSGNGHAPPHSHDHGNAGGLRARLATVFGAHNHDHTESVDQALTTSLEGTRCLKVSLVILALTAVVELAVVAVSGSVALLADTIHNGADALTAVPLAIAFRLGRRPPNRRYTYGYGRAEDLAGIFIVAVIAFSAGVAGWEAVTRLFDAQGVSNLGWVAVAGVVSFAGNEIVASYRIRVGRCIGSAALVADGHHARVDALTSLAVVAGAAGVAMGFPEADPLAGLLITVAVLFVLRGAARDIYRRLMDSVDPALVGRVESVLLGVPGIKAVSRVRIRWIGHELRAEAHVTSDCALSLTEAHDIAEEGHHRLLHEVPRLAEAVIHTSPCDHDGRDSHAALAHHFPDRTQPEG